MSSRPPISVYVVDYGRKFLQLQWKDPVTGLRRTESSGKTRRRDAERVAAEKERALNSGKYGADGSIPWSEWRERIELEAGSGLAESTQSQITGILNRVEQSINPATLADLDAAGLSGHAVWLREEGRSESTIKSHLRHLRALLQWSVDQLLIAEIPAIPKVRRARKSKEMKGRPITDDEFRKMLKAIPQVVGAAREASWKQLLVGLYLSGLRRDESLSLSWEAGDQISVVITDRGRCRLRIPGGHQKSGRDELLPMSPRFSRWLLKIPVDQRTGWVFNPAAKSRGRQNNPFDVGRTISAIGQAAGIVVDETFRNGQSKKKYASAHDLRRSFGAYWAVRVMPPVLQKMMRHENISTTMKYYAHLEIEDTERVLYREKRKRRHNKKHNTDNGENAKPQ